MGATEGETFKIENKKDKLSLNMQKIWFFTNLCAKTNKCETSAQQKGKGKQTNIFSDSQQFHKLFFQRGYGQRKQKKEKGNKCVRNGKKRREKKRQQMNKSMSKGTYRGNACMKKG